MDAQFYSSRQLPETALQSIALYAGLEEGAALAAVCKEWNRIVDSEHVWKKRVLINKEVKKVYYHHFFYREWNSFSWKFIYELAVKVITERDKKSFLKDKFGRSKCFYPFTNYLARNRYQCQFLKRNCEKGYELHLIQRIFDLILKREQKRIYDIEVASVHLKEGARMHQIKTIDFEKKVAELIKIEIGKYRDKKSEHVRQIKNIFSKTGLQPKRQLAVLKKAGAYVSRDMFDKIPQPYQFPSFKEFYFAWNMMYEVLHENILVQNGLHSVSKEDDYTTEEIEMYQLQNIEHLLDAFPAVYTMIKLHEPCIKPLISLMLTLKGRTKVYRYFYLKGKIALSNLRYYKIRDPKPGDLVVYSYESESNSTTVKHYGIYQKTGLIRSKLGRMGKVSIYDHDLFGIPYYFGNSAAFYRKKKSL